MMVQSPKGHEMILISDFHGHEAMVNLSLGPVRPLDFRDSLGNQIPFERHVLGQWNAFGILFEFLVEKVQSPNQRRLIQQRVVPGKCSESIHGKTLSALRFSMSTWVQWMLPAIQLVSGFVIG